MSTSPVRHLVLTSSTSQSQPPGTINNTIQHTHPIDKEQQQEHQYQSHQIEILHDPSKTWSSKRKWQTITTACLVSFVVGINATAILAATDSIAEHFNISSSETGFDYTVFLVTAWNGGAAVVPLFILPMMEDLGYRTIYFGSYILFMIFVMVQAISPNFATLIVARVISGSFGGVLQNCVDGIVADVWGEDVHNRAVALSVYIFALLGGVTIGPVIGGAISSTLYWRWILYIQLIIYGVVLVYALITLHDPRAELNRSKPPSTRQERISLIVNETILRALRMLFTEFVVGTFTLLSAFAFGTVFVMTQSIPQVYTELYGWKPWQTGVVQVSIFLGEMVGLAMCLFQDVVIYPRYACRQTKPPTFTPATITPSTLHPPNPPHSSAIQSPTRPSPPPPPSSPLLSTPTTLPPEPRLYTLIPTTLLIFTPGFFIYGHLSSPEYSWLLPSLGLFLIGIGTIVIVQAVTVYITDCYATHASSAISAVAFGENLFAGVLPLATKKMYTVLGARWASRLLGFVALGLGLAPILLVIFGRRWRVRQSRKFTM